MASISSIFVDFVARTAGFQQGVEKAADTVRQAGSQMAESNKNAQLSAEKMGEGFAKSGVRIAMGMAGAMSATALIAREMRDVFRNVEDMPGISSPVVESVQKLRFEMTKVKEAADGLGATVLTGLSAMATTAYLAFIEVRDGVSAATEAGKRLEEQAKAYASQGFDKEMAKLKTQMDMLNVSRGAEIVLMRAKSFLLSTDASGTQKQQWDNQIQAAKDNIEAMKLENGLKREAHDLLDQETRKTFQLKVAQLGAADAVKLLTGEIAGLKAKQDAASNAAGGVPWSNPTSLEAWMESQKKIVKLTEDLKTAAERALKPFNEMVHVLGDNLTTAFADTFNGGADAFKNFSKTVLLEIEKIMIRTLLVKSIFASIGSQLGGGTSFVGKLGTAFTKYAGMMANGGEIGHGEFALVGERGPELLAKPGTVISNDRIAAAVAGGTSRGGGDTHVYNIDASGADAGKIEELKGWIRSLHQSIEPRSVAAVINARRRGGGMAHALA